MVEALIGVLVVRFNHLLAAVILNHPPAEYLVSNKETGCHALCDAAWVFCDGSVDYVI